jgi:hypothetical protein
VTARSPSGDGKYHSLAETQMENSMQYITEKTEKINSILTGG